MKYAGFIIFDDAAIWGSGPTDGHAWSDFERVMSEAGVDVLDDDDVVKNGPRTFVWSRDFECTPATPALLVALADHGGTIPFRFFSDELTACTVEEFEAEMDDYDGTPTRSAEYS